MEPDALCPCHSQRPYAACCQPFHRGGAAPTPLALMRSRYSAYALGRVRYIQATTHPASPHAQADLDELRRFCEQTRFTGLEILEASGDRVRFRALLDQGGRDATMVEDSQFQKLGDRWTYVGPA